MPSQVIRLLLSQSIFFVTVKNQLSEDENFHFQVFQCYSDLLASLDVLCQHHTVLFSQLHSVFAVLGIDAPRSSMCEAYALLFESCPSHFVYLAIFDQAGLCDPPVSTYRGIGIRVVCHYTWLLILYFEDRQHDAFSLRLLWLLSYFVVLHRL